MSHVATVNVRITDLAALEEACSSRGWKLTRGKTTYAWYGSWVGDTPFTADMFDTVEEYERMKALPAAEQRTAMTAMLNGCDHAISIPGCSYDIGVRQKPDGTFRLLWDFWGTGGLEKALGGPTAPKLVQAYGVAKMIAESRRLGHVLESQEMLADGTVRLRLLAAR